MSAAAAVKSNDQILTDAERVLQDLVDLHYTNGEFDAFLDSEDRGGRFGEFYHGKTFGQCYAETVLFIQAAKRFFQKRETMLTSLAQSDQKKWYAWVHPESSDAGVDYWTEMEAQAFCEGDPCLEILGTADTKEAAQALVDNPNTCGY